MLTNIFSSSPLTDNTQKGVVKSFHRKFHCENSLLDPPDKTHIYDHALK